MDQEDQWEIVVKMVRTELMVMQEKKDQQELPDHKVKLGPMDQMVYQDVMEMQDYQDQEEKREIVELQGIKESKVVKEHQVH